MLKDIISSIKDYKYNLKFEYQLGKADLPGAWKKNLLSLIWCFVKMIVCFAISISIFVWAYHHRYLLGFN